MTDDEPAKQLEHQLAAARSCLKCDAEVPADVIAAPDGACPACGAIYRKSD